ncbi:MATE efflux family protein [Desulfatibacillum aliphaticivorans]|uniref:Multidrug export protein MepA n=1 Tax=Desulfatibacillum aliphaticivorans TaxID=218208 RepID=B8FFI6_DESAL|nr:MATE family efflux transporter [Desulfatibacillum aliphaticivorans]ACL04246.1 MATE efflux family protein [Desulfatibacillum aliphaticivorans]
MNVQTRGGMLAADSIGSLLMKLSLPAIISMFVQAMYNTVDTIFIGRWVGTLGIGAISLVLPIVFLIMAACQAIGVGGASIISRRMGAGDADGVGRTFGNMTLLALLLGVGVQLAGLFAITPLLRIFGASDTLLPLTWEYFRIIMLAGPLMTFAMTANNAVRAEGAAKMAMLTMMSGAVLNTILDPIFIYVLKMGIRGAAWATVASMFLSTVMLLLYFKSGRSEIPLGARYMRLKFFIIREIAAVGSSAFVRVGAASITVAILNHTLSYYEGDVGVATFGIIFRVLSFILMPVMGLSMGLQPVVGFNYGARSYSRVREAVKLGVMAATTVAASGFLVIFLFPEAIVSVFSKDPLLMEYASNAIRLSMLALPVVGCHVVGTAFFQAIGKAAPALMLTLCRQVLVVMPLILTIPRLCGAEYIWFAFPIADAVSFTLTTILVWRVLKKIPKIEASSSA